jgi:hypothetical protein
MKAVRGAMSVFLLVICWLAIMGWRWSASLSSPKIEGARVVLVITAAAACTGLIVIWNYNPRRSL